MQSRFLLAVGSLIVVFAAALAISHRPSSAQGLQPVKPAWEYKVELMEMGEKRDVDSELSLIEKQLNDRAREGWELCQIQLRTLIFKRAK